VKHVDVAIIGAGSAGLSARREVARTTDNYVVIDDGPLGTTCARVGCMPSKVLIQVADDFHRRHSLAQEGIAGGDQLSVDKAAVMDHVRALRDRFVKAVRSDMAQWTETHLIPKRARLKSLNEIDLGDESIRADRIIIATGSRPIIPQAWQQFGDRLIDTDRLFELKTLPDRLAVVGLGVIGLELGQALARLGIEVHGFTMDPALGGLTDPSLQDYMGELVSQEFPITFQAVDRIEPTAEGLAVTAGGHTVTVDAVFTAMGRRPNTDRLGLEDLALPRDEQQKLVVNPGTFRIGDSPLYLAGDAHGERPILHEASDEGRIAGYNAVNDDHCFQRRTKLSITFSSPNIAVIGRSHRELTQSQMDFVTGRVSYEGQGRAIVKLAEKGELHVYVDRKNGSILGAELIAPQGEHIAHLLAWAIAARINVFEALSLPFYHPVLEEGLRTALRDAAAQVEGDRPPLEVLRCQDPPVGSWAKTEAQS
jgi:dihydrolipoamide dehydrogenase